VQTAANVGVWWCEELVALKADPLRGRVAPRTAPGEICMRTALVKLHQPVLTLKESVGKFGVLGHKSATNPINWGLRSVTVQMPKSGI